MTKSKIVSATVRMQALALFTMANQNYLRADAYGNALAELLGYDNGWADGFGEEWLEEKANFDKAFKNEGFTVRAAKTKAKKQRLMAKRGK